MFTSRAEYRLLFNHASAELRLIDLIADMGLLSESRKKNIREKQEKILYWTDALEKTLIKGGYAGNVLRKDITLVPADLPEAFTSLSNEIKEEVLYRVRYAGYLSRELKTIERMKDLERVAIPAGLDYDKILGLRIESRQKLSSIRPINLAQAERISGVSPADISLLMVYLRSRA